MKKDRLLWIVFAASVVIALATLLISQLTKPEIPEGIGPVFPRTAAPPRAMNMDELLRVMGIGALTWYACILSAPLFILLGRRLPFDRQRWPVSLLVHFAVIVALVLSTSYIQHTFTYAGAYTKPPIGTYLQVALMTGFMPFVAVAAAAHALDASRIKRQLAEARLSALTAQLQPHFLFNTLQGISTLIPRDAAAADRMLSNLSDLLREVLRRGETQEVTVAEELRVLEPYLDISRTRFGERLTIDIEVDDAAHNALVPFFLLQPLVENAVAHGIGARAGHGRIDVRATRSGKQLIVTVSNDSTGTSGTGEGIGLSNTHARLREMYGSNYELNAEPRDDGGFDVRIRLPYREGA